MKKITINIILLSQLLFSNENIFNKEVGSFIYVPFKNKAEITLINNSISKTFKIANKDTYNYILDSLTLMSDSINSPDAFEIKTDLEILRCVKRSYDKKDSIKESCVIRKEIEQERIEVIRKNFYLTCSRKSI